MLQLKLLKKKSDYPDAQERFRDIADGADTTAKIQEAVDDIAEALEEFVHPAYHAKCAHLVKTAIENMNAAQAEMYIRTLETSLRKVADGTKKNMRIYYIVMTLLAVIWSINIAKLLLFLYIEWFVL